MKARRRVAFRLPPDVDILERMLGFGCRRQVPRASLLAASLVACHGGGSNSTTRAGAAGVTVAALSGSRLPARAEHDLGAPSVSPMQASAASSIQTVFLILLENKAWSEVKGSEDAPYLNGALLPQASIAEGYRAPRGGNLHPSLPNYIWLEAGDNLDITNDDDPGRNHRDTPDHLVTLLEKKKISWRAYQEDIGGDVCPLERVREYAPKHDPMVFFDDVTNTNNPKSPRCIEHVRPLSELERDLSAGSVARYNFITPNECNDMHTSCEPLRNVVKQGDNWLSVWIPKILSSRAYQDRGALFVTWDEAEPHTPDCLFGDCPVGLIVLSPLAKGGGYTNTIAYDHSSMLRSIQRIFGVPPFLRGAATASDLSALFTTFP